MWVCFSKPYDFTPAEDRRVTIAYPVGHIGSVRRACGEAAIAAGAAEPHVADGQDTADADPA